MYPRYLLPRPSQAHNYPDAAHWADLISVIRYADKVTYGK